MSVFVRSLNSSGLISLARSGVLVSALHALSQISTRAALFQAQNVLFSVIWIIYIILSIKPESIMNANENSKLPWNTIEGPEKQNLPGNDDCLSPLCQLAKRTIASTAKIGSNLW